MSRLALCFFCCAALSSPKNKSSKPIVHLHRGGEGERGLTKKAKPASRAKTDFGKTPPTEGGWQARSQSN